MSATPFGGGSDLHDVRLFNAKRCLLGTVADEDLVFSVHRAGKAFLSLPSG